MSEKKHNDPTPKDIRVADIVGSTWNTHRAKKEDADLAGLVENIGHNGMIHRIAVRTLPDGKYEIVDGHRRFDAAKLCGWKTVPCEVYEGMGDEEAQTLTLSANVQRLENDPLLESELIERLRGERKTYEEIAATLGKDARYVARRARLCSLTQRWRDWFGRNAADVATMEEVARHDAKLQDAAWDALGMDDGGDVYAEDIEAKFRDMLRPLDEDTGFDIEAAGCLSCPCNTATQGLLFEPEAGECDGRCQDAACYARHWNAATDAAIERLRKKNVVVWEAAQKWDIPNCWNATDSKTKKNTEPWTYEKDGIRRLVWVEPNAAAPAVAAPAKTEAEKAEEKRVRKAHSAWERSRKSAYGKIRAAAENESLRRRMVEKAASQDAFGEVMTDVLRERLDGFANDELMHTVYRIFGAEGLAEFGCDVTAEEVNALLTKDPAEDGGNEE